MPNLGENFYPKLVQMASELGMKPEDILVVMCSESGLNPSISNSIGAAGLIQLLPGYLPKYYEGSAKSFKQMSGESQLDVIKKVIQSQISMNGGKPFKSAAQYYLANFVPALLSLRGVQNEDPSTVLLRKTPSSKGILGISQESDYYESNKIFDRNVKGYITYGDMIKQVNSTKSKDPYLSAVAKLKASIGHDSSQEEENISNNDNVDGIKALKDLHTKLNPEEQVAVTPVKQNILTPSAKKDSFFDELMNKGGPTIKSFFGFSANSHDKSYKKIYKKALPLNKILIKINSNNYNNGIEFSRILCSALEEDLLANASIYTNNKNIDIECDIYGPELVCFNSVKQLTNAISDTFKDATIKIGGIKITTNCIINKTSSYDQLSLEKADFNYRKFLLKFI